MARSSTGGYSQLPYCVRVVVRERRDGARGAPSRRAELVLDTRWNAGRGRRVLRTRRAAQDRVAPCAQQGPLRRRARRRVVGPVGAGQGCGGGERHGRPDQQHLRACVRAECASRGGVGPRRPRRVGGCPRRGARSASGDRTPVDSRCVPGIAGTHSARPGRSRSQRDGGGSPAGRAAPRATDTSSGLRCSRSHSFASPRARSMQQWLPPASASAYRRRSRTPKAPSQRSTPWRGLSKLRATPSARDVSTCRRSRSPIESATSLRSVRRSKRWPPSRQRATTTTSAVRLIDTAELERTAHEMPLHAPDRERLRDLRRAAEKELAVAAIARRDPIYGSSTADVIASLLPRR